MGSFLFSPLVPHLWTLMGRNMSTFRSHAGHLPVDLEIIPTEIWLWREKWVSVMSRQKENRTQVSASPEYLQWPSDHFLMIVSQPIPWAWETCKGQFLNSHANWLPVKSSSMESKDCGLKGRRKSLQLLAPASISPAAADTHDSSLQLSSACTAQVQPHLLRGPSIDAQCLPQWSEYWLCRDPSCRLPWFWSFCFSCFVTPALGEGRRQPLR